MSNLINPLVQDTEINLKQGCVIVFEGIDGSGKSTLIGKLKDKLSYIYGANQVSTFVFPSVSLKDAILKQKPNQTDLVDMFLNDFANHLASIKGDSNRKIVLIDRMYWSTYVYAFYHFLQKTSYSQKELLSAIQSHLGNWSPDINVFIDVKPAIAVQRHTTRGEQNWLDGDIKQLTNLRTGFLSVWNSETRKNLPLINQITNYQKWIVLDNSFDDIRHLDTLCLNLIMEIRKKLVL